MVRAVDFGPPPVLFGAVTVAALIAAADAAAARRDLATAASLLDQAVAGDGRDAAAWKKLAACRRALGQPGPALAAITAALALDPRDALSLLMKGALTEAAGDDAEEAYRAALAFLPDPARLPPPLRAQRDHAARYCAAAATRRADRLAATADRAAAPLALTPTERTRIATFVAALAQGETSTVLPGLSRPAYFAPELFAGLAEVARAHARYTREYLALMREEGVAVPYVDHPAGVPLDQWAALNRSTQWSAAHLWRGGTVVAVAARRCPETVAAFETLPVPVMPGRAPNLMFSILAPRTRIPRHVGVINARLVVHIPLIVPPDCAMIVGDDARAWVPGDALVFDDTLEHEAHNDSDEVRVVLIGDAWHPDLSANERTVLSALLARA